MSISRRWRSKLFVDQSLQLKAYWVSGYGGGQGYVYFYSDFLYPVVKLEIIGVIGLELKFKCFNLGVLVKFWAGSSSLSSEQSSQLLFLVGGGRVKG